MSSSKIFNRNPDGKGKLQDYAIKKVFIYTQALAIIITYLLISFLGPDLLKYIIFIDLSLSFIWIAGLSTLIRPIIEKSISTIDIIIPAAISVFLTILSALYLNNIADPIISILIIICGFLAAMIMFTVIIHIVYSLKPSYLREIFEIIIISIIYKLIDLDVNHIIPEDIKVIFKLFLGIFCVAALIALILEFSKPISLIIYLHKGAVTLTVAVNLILWKNESDLQMALGLNVDQMIFLYIIMIPLCFLFELILDDLLKKLFGFVTRGVKVDENYKDISYIIMIYVTAIALIATGLAENEPEKQVVTMFSNPIIIIILIIIAVLLKHLEISLRSHVVLANKGLPESVKPGEKITYTITARKKGHFSAKNVKVTNEVINAAYVSSTTNKGSYDPVKGIWSIGDLAKGETANLNLVIVAGSPPSKVVTNAIMISSLKLDPWSRFKKIIVSTNVLEVADIEIALTGSPKSVHTGKQVTYTITVKNNGPSLARDVKVEDKIPNDTAYVSSSTSKGLYDPAKGIWSIGDLAKGETATFSLVVAAGSPRSKVVTNTAKVSSLTPPLEQGENISIVNINIDELADIDIVLTGSPKSVHTGEQVTYTITVKNNGPSLARDVKVEDKIPNDTTYVSSSTSNGLYDPLKGIWSIGDLAKDETATFNLVVLAGSPSSMVVKNTAKVSSLTPPLEQGKNSSIVNIDIDELSDIEIALTGSPKSVHTGEQIIYTITVKNNGPSFARDVKVEDKIPNDTTYVSSSTSKGSYDPVKGIWSISDLAKDETATFSLVVSAGSPRSLVVTNTAKVSSLTPLLEQGKKSSIVNIDINELADIDIVLTGSPKSVHTGEQVTYTITVKNNGPSLARDVKVEDKIPNDTTYVSSSSNKGSYDPTNGIWSVGDLAKGESATFILVVIAGSPLGNAVVNRSTIKEVKSYDKPKL